MDAEELAWIPQGLRCWQLGLLSLALTWGGRASGAGSWVC